MTPWLPTLALAYLLGSIPFGYLLVRIFRRQDIRSLGSGNIGATNVARSGAKGLALATLLLDCLKGAIAVLLAFYFAHHAGLEHHVDADPGRAAAFDLACAAAITVTLGHVFPVWLRLHGGKGVATALGVFLVLSPATIGCALLLFLAVFAITRYVSLASVLAAAAIPAASWFFLSARTPWTFAAFLGIPLLVILKHHANIRRLLSGTESRFGSRSAVA